jgi:hypothetical protein
MRHLSRRSFLTASVLGLASRGEAAGGTDELGRGPCADATVHASLAAADDPFLSDADRQRSAAAGRFAWILAPRQDGGRLVVDFNLRLKPEGTGFEPNILHGRAGCGLG